jgi:macrolide-specific efflux system membrane fusion protein
LASCLTSGCFLLPKEEEELTPPALIKPAERIYDMMPVVRQTLRREVTGPAVFVPRVFADQYFTETGGVVRQVYVALGDQVDKNDLLAELHTGDLADRIELQVLAVRRSEILVDVKRKSGSAPYELEIAEIEHASEVKRLEMMRRQLSSANLRATMAGIVVFVDRTYAPGNAIPAYRSLIRIADPDELELRYNGSDWNSFVIGAEVEVRIQGRFYTGVVVQAPGNAPANSADDQRNAVFVKLDTLPEGVASGHLAQITLVLEERPDTLVIPRDAVREYLGRRYVYIFEDGSRKERTVEIGIETGRMAEIIDGLDEGQLVILR